MIHTAGADSKVPTPSTTPPDGLKLLYFTKKVSHYIDISRGTCETVITKVPTGVCFFSIKRSCLFQAS